MFRVQDNVPEVYINESRDFQILARLSDVLFSGMKYDIDSMVNILDATLARDTMLELMCTKIGFFPRTHIDANVLKYIIASFPYILKYKGTRLGIEWAVNAILKAENNPDAIGRPNIVITDSKITDTTDVQAPYTVYIYTTIQIYNKAALKEVLRYVLPAGYNYQILSYYDINEGSAYKALFEHQDELRIIRTPVIKTSAIRTSDTLVSLSEDGSIDSENLRLTSFASQTANAFDTTQLVTSDMYRSAGGVANNPNISVDGIVEILPTYNIVFKIGNTVIETVTVHKYSYFEYASVPASVRDSGMSYWIPVGTEIDVGANFSQYNFFDTETGKSKRPITANITLVGFSDTDVNQALSGGNE